MNRIVVRKLDEGEVINQGWFDADKAELYKEESDYDGRNLISRNTGKPFAHEELYRTEEGRWVLGCYSNYSGTLPGYEYIGSTAARAWLIRNLHDETVIKHFGEVETEHGPPLQPASSMLRVIQRAQEFAQTHGDTKLADELYVLGCTLGSRVEMRDA